MAVKARKPGQTLAPVVRNVPPAHFEVARQRTAILFVGCWPDGPVAPGEPFSITWQIWSVNSAPNLGQIYAQVYLDGQLVHTTPTVTFVGQQWGGDTGLQHEQAIVPPADPTLRAKLYALGTKTLELRAIASGPDAAQWDLTTQWDLDVQPMFAPASNPPSDAQALWDMDCAPDQVNYVGYHFNVPVDWGSQYALKATVTNTGTAGLAGGFHLHSVAKNDPGDQHDSVTQSVQGPQPFLQPGQTGTLVVKNVDAEKFFWFSPVGFFPLEAQGADHIYTWSVVSHLTDEFGNDYGDLSLDLLAVDVKVQSWKYDLILAAMATAAVGTVLVLLPWPIDVVGAALIVTAGGLALAALDPPAPSPRYRQKVRLAPEPVPAQLLEDPRLAAYADLVDVLHRMIAAHWALTEIHSRLLGARSAGDADAESLQVDTYRGTLDYLTGAAARLNPTVAAAVAAEGIEDALKPSAVRKLLRSVENGVSPARRRAWTRAGASAEIQSHASALVRDPRFKALARDGVAPLLGLLGPILTRYAARRRAESATILVGSPPPPLGPRVVDWGRGGG